MMGTPKRPDVDLQPVDRDMNAWVADQLGIDAGQVLLRGTHTFRAIPPGGFLDDGAGGFAEVPDGQVLITWLGLATIPEGDYRAKLAELKLQHEGGKHRADR